MAAPQAPSPAQDEAVRARLRELSLAAPESGYRTLHAALQRAHASHLGQLYRGEHVVLAGAAEQRPLAQQQQGEADTVERPASLDRWA